MLKAPDTLEALLMQDDGFIPPLPAPSPVHATCAWCRLGFATITDLLSHVDHSHVD